MGQFGWVSVFGQNSSLELKWGSEGLKTFVSKPKHMPVSRAH